MPKNNPAPSSLRDQIWTSIETAPGSMSAPDRKAAHEEAAADLARARDARRAEHQAQAEIIRRRMVETRKASPGPLKVNALAALCDSSAARTRASRTGTVGRLFRAGTLSDACMRAAEELCTVYLIREDGQLSVVPLAERVDTSSRGAAPRFLDACAAHFARWRDDLIRGSDSFGSPRPQVFQVTVACAVYDFSLAEVQRRLEIRRNGVTGDYLRLGLQHYADIMHGKAGRVRRDPAMRNKGA